MREREKKELRQLTRGYLLLIVSLAITVFCFYWTFSCHGGMLDKLMTFVIGISFVVEFYYGHKAGNPI